MAHTRTHAASYHFSPLSSTERCQTSATSECPCALGPSIASADIPAGRYLWEDLELSSINVLNLTGLSASLKHADIAARADQEGGSDRIPPQHRLYAAATARPEVRTICEVGFNGGQSALVWLVAAPRARVIMFDLGMHAAVDVALGWLRAHPLLNAASRLELHRGDSNKTVLRFAQENPQTKCDVISIDGGHSEAHALADLRNFQLLARPCCNLGLIDDTPFTPSAQRSYVIGPRRAYRRMQREGHVCTWLNLVQSVRGVTVFQYR